MTTKEIDKYLDNIYTEIFSNLDGMYRFNNESCFISVARKLDNIKRFIEPNSSLYEKYKVLYNASFFISNRFMLHESDTINAKKYFNWIKISKKVTEQKIRNEKISVENANEMAKASAEINYPVNSGISKPLSNNQLEEKRPEPKEVLLPKKVSTFDKIRNRFRSFISKLIPKKEEKAKGNQSNVKTESKYNVDIVAAKERFQRELRFEGLEQTTPMVENRKEIKNENKKETIVIGDIHGDMQKWMCVKDAMRKNPNIELIILGDAMDRGNYGLEILLQIKELCDKGKAVYLPGNHDEFAYNYLKTKGTKYEDSEAAQGAKANWEGNGGAVTMQSFENFDYIIRREVENGRLSKTIKKEELVDWLGNCPIQKKVKSEKINYALGHAMFDEKLYNEDPGFSLKKALMLELAGKNDINLKRFNNCMWYREGEDYTHFTDLSLPSNSVILVGHTRQNKINLGSLGNDPNKPILYIDCGKGMLQGYSITKDMHVDLEDRDRDERI